MENEWKACFLTPYSYRIKMCVKEKETQQH